MAGEIVLESDDGEIIRQPIDNSYVVFLEDEISEESLLVTIWPDGSFGTVQSVNTDLQKKPTDQDHRRIFEPHELEKSPFIREKFGYAGKIGRLTIQLINR